MALQGPPPTPGPSGPPFDPNLIPVMLGDVVPMIVAGLLLLVGLRWFLRSPMGEAIAESIRARTHRLVPDGESQERVAHLEQQVDALQRQLAEVAERVDFAERLLAERRERKLSAGQ